MKRSEKKIVIRTLVAALIGFLAGILVAPKSGQETRKEIKNRTEQLKELTEKKIQQLEKELNDKIESVTQEIEELGSQGKSEISDILASAKKTKVKMLEIMAAWHDGNTEDKELTDAIKEAKHAIKSLEKYLREDK